MILDIPGPHSQWGLSLAKLCDELLLVTTNELPAVHATQNTLACLEHHGVSKSKIKLIINRYNTEIGLSSESLETALELKVFQHLPSDFESVQKALMEGKPIPSTTKVGKSIAELAKTDRPHGFSKETLPIWRSVLRLSVALIRPEAGPALRSADARIPLLARRVERRRWKPLR